ncbi:MAG: tetratricopeptide repeat protein [Acidobacteriaceae bacterium]|nr:tetratricopeptide repeat protein [Acidobacteriaceae bacterium]
MKMHSTESAPDERLGTVSFSVSCAPAVQASFNRGVALLHDFWYQEAGPQFEQIAKADPGCAMAHWGLAMSRFHQIWDRPDEATMKFGWAEIQKAQAPHAKTSREQEYIAALAVFYKPGKQDYMARITAYANAMGALYKRHPDDVDAGAFYALSLLAAGAPDDTSLRQNQRAMAVLTPLFAKYPDNPGLVHYIIHACDNPAMAADGLAAAQRYGVIAPSGPHAVHMSGHIFARLGMWPEDIESQLGSIAASEAAEARGESGIMDEPHSYDFLMYAYLQSGQDANARGVLDKMPSVLDRLGSMGDREYMTGMVPYYRSEFPVIYALEMRDWQTASTLKAVPGAPPQIETQIWWARAISDGHLHHAEQAQADLAKYDALMVEVKKGRHAYEADSTGAQIGRDEIAGWAAFAANRQDEALKDMRAAADLQDKVGQGEVDIPAREMLADMLLELHQPQQALAEYRIALKLSPNRFNGLYHAGEAAEAAGNKRAAAEFYAALLKSTGNGASSSRPEMAHAKNFVASEQLAEK